MRGMIVPIDGGGSAVTFQWNPKEFQGWNKGAEYAELKTAGSDKPFFEFANGTAPELTFDLELTGVGTEGSIDDIMALMDPSGGGQTLKRPPRCAFVFGEAKPRICVVTSGRVVKRGWFDPKTLKPHYARVTVTLREPRL